MISREIEVGQNNTKKSYNFEFYFSREIEVGQNNAYKSDNFSREIEVCQNNLGIYVSPRYITVNLPEQL